MTDVNDVYEALDLFYDGLVDPREVIDKAMMDQSALHVAGVVGRVRSAARSNAALRKPVKGFRAMASAAADVANPKRVKMRTATIRRNANANAQAAVEGDKMFRRISVGTALVGTGTGAYIVGQKRQKKKDDAASPIIKSMSWDAKISEIDEDKRQVFGFATVTHVNGEEVVDKQGDYIPVEEIEKAAYNYVLTSRKGGDMHARDGDGPKHTADLIESVVFSEEKANAMGIKDAPSHGWWIGMRVNDDEQWEMVKDGRRSGFSIHGSGKRREM